jgi:hypothetical protein
VVWKSLEAGSSDSSDSEVEEPFEDASPRLAVGDYGGRETRCVEGADDESGECETPVGVKGVRGRAQVLCCATWANARIVFFLGRLFQTGDLSQGSRT